MRSGLARVIQNFMLPAWETHIRRRPTLQYLENLNDSQYWSPQKLGSWQNRALLTLIAHAVLQTEYYKNVFAERNLSPRDITTVSDLQKLPILDRQTARATTDSRRIVTEGPFVQKSTGGTTGEPLVVEYNLDSEYWRQAVKNRGFSWAGFQLGDRAIHYWGAPLHAKSMFHRAKIQLDRKIKAEVYVDCTSRNDGHRQELVRLIQKHQPTAIFCYAQAGAELARYINQNGLRDWDTISVLCSAERVLPPDRAALEQAFGPAVFETYGCREVMLIAMECEKHDGLHTAMENVIVELVDDQGRHVPPGQPGHVLLTDLHNYRQPLIRYKNGDMAIAYPEANCSCGRGLLRLQNIEGRSTETLRNRQGESVDGMVFNLAFSVIAEYVRQFQATQHKDGSITLKMIPWKSNVPASAMDIVRKQCAVHLPGVPIQFETVAAIPDTASGKRRIVVVES